MNKQHHLKVIETEPAPANCTGIHELIDWEIIQYRKEVDAHRLDLSKVESRCVAWQEAEQDFNASDRVALEEKWRSEYCGSICKYRENCLTAAQLLSKRGERILRVG